MILHHNNFSQYYKLYLCPFLSLHLSKRFFPAGANPLVGSLSLSTSKRILRLFNKDNLLTNKYSSEHMNRVINDLHEIKKNRREFFKMVREISQNKLEMDTSLIHNPKYFTTLKQLGDFARLLNPPKLLINSSTVRDDSIKQGLLQPLKGLSPEEKKKICLHKYNILVNEMKEFIKNYELNKIIDEKLIIKWANHMENRGSLIPEYIPGEIEINEALRKILIENTESKEVVLSRLTNKLQELKKQSDLPTNISIDKMQEKCFTEQDYKDKIKSYEDVIEYINTTKEINNETLMLLGIQSNAITFDEKQKPKFNSEIYIMASQNPEEFGIKKTMNKPDYEEIMQALESGRYFVKDNSDEIPKDNMLSTAPLLHKTIVIPTSKGLYYTSMFTSAKTGTECLSLTQECNLDPKTNQKEQRFLVFSRFILCKDTSIINDLLALGFSNAINLQGEDVHKKIIGFFKDKRNLWENNFVEELMDVTPSVLENIILKFCKKNLEKTKEEYNGLIEDMKNLSKDQKNKYKENLEEEKIKAQNLQQEQKYLSCMKDNVFPIIYKTLSKFDAETKQQKKNKIEQEKKLEIETIILNKEHLIQQEKEERLRTGKLTITERRIAMQKKIKEDNESKLYAIENTKPKDK